MKTPKNAASDTLIRRVRGAGPDGRARTEGKDKPVPVPPVMGPSGGKTRGHPIVRSPRNILTYKNNTTRTPKTSRTGSSPSLPWPAS